MILFCLLTPHASSARAQTGLITIGKPSTHTEQIGALKLYVECDTKEDGRGIAETPEMSGVMWYGASRNDAAVKVEALALRTIS